MENNREVMTMRKQSKANKLPADPHQLFLLAMQFTTANVILMKHRTKHGEVDKHSFMTAYSINELFTYELLLKCLICLAPIQACFFSS